MTKTNKDRKKMYVIRKYIEASSITEARTLDKSAPPDEIFLDSTWLNNSTFLATEDDIQGIGFSRTETNK